MNVKLPRIDNSRSSETPFCKHFEILFRRF
jgi:hypothetical protein